MTAKKICVLGISTTDVVFSASRLPKMGETLMGSKFSSGPGGKGANQAIAIARTGGEVFMICKVGQDQFGHATKSLFSKENINAEYVFESTTGTASAMAFIFLDDATAENAIIVTPGAAWEISTADIDTATSALIQSDIFITQLETPVAVAEYALAQAKKYGCTTILNPAPACVLSDSIYTHIDIITPNETETEILTGVHIKTLRDAEKSADILRKKGVKTAIITLGEQGVYVKNDSLNQRVPAFKIDTVVDTTGAGDAFNGGFANALSQGKDIIQACIYGCAVAGISVSRLGASQGTPTAGEVQALLDTQLDTQ